MLRQELLDAAAGIPCKANMSLLLNMQWNSIIWEKEVHGSENTERRPAEASFSLVLNSKSKFTGNEAVVQGLKTAWGRCRVGYFTVALNTWGARLGAV